MAEPHSDEVFEYEEVSIRVTLAMKKLISYNFYIMHTYPGEEEKRGD
jgi:hypothetical protein